MNLFRAFGGSKEMNEITDEIGMDRKFFKTTLAERKVNFALMAIVILICTSTSGTMASASESTLKNQYQKFQNSWLADVLEFRCGNSIFKLEKTALSGVSLYFKNDLEWASLDNLVLKPSGITFDGLGIKGGGVPDRELLKQVNLLNRDGEQTRIKFKENFLYVLENTEFVNYSYKIDFYKEKLEGKNSQKIVNDVMLNHSKYKKYGMSYRNSIDISALSLCFPNSKLGSKERKIEAEKCREKRKIREKEQEKMQQIENEKFVQKTLDLFHEPIVVTTPLGGNLLTDYCYQM